MVEHYTAEQITEMVKSGGVTVCYSRCLYCGRRTPHEVCHAHSEASNPGWYSAETTDIDALWGTGRQQEDESCVDPTCPVWEPGEWERRAQRASGSGEGESHDQ